MKKARDYPVLAVSAFIEKAGKYLLVNDPKMKYWRVPGGRVDYGEKVEATLKREMKEELDIDVDVKEFLGFGQDKVVIWEKLETSRLVLFFRCGFSGEIKIKDEKEVLEFRWLTLDEIKKHDKLEPVMLDLFRRFNVK